MSKELHFQKQSAQLSHRTLLLRLQNNFPLLHSLNRQRRNTHPKLSQQTKLLAPLMPLTP